MFSGGAFDAVFERRFDCSVNSHNHCKAEVDNIPSLKRHCQCASI